MRRASIPSDISQQLGYIFRQSDSDLHNKGVYRLWDRRCRKNAIATGTGKSIWSGRKTTLWLRSVEPQAQVCFHQQTGHLWKPPSLILVPTCGQSVPKRGHTPGKVAGQRATVMPKMNGVTSGLDRRPPSRWMGGQSFKVSGRTLSELGVFSFSNLKWAGKSF